MLDDTQKRNHDSFDIFFFEDNVKRGAKKPLFEIMKITPALARHILKKNAVNRAVKRHVVLQFASDIEKGFFQLNGETVIISTDGYLNDGQHRLLAVIKAGLPAEMAVMFGASRESRETVDMGTSRQASDILAINGVKNTTATAAASRILLMYSLGIFTVGGSNYQNEISDVTKQNVVNFYKSNSDKIDFIVNKFCNVPFFKRGGVAVWIAAYFLVSKESPSYVNEFFEKAATGESLKRGDPILMLRSHILETVNTGIKSPSRLEIILRYWNAWREGKSLTRRISMNGSYPKISV